MVYRITSRLGIQSRFNTVILPILRELICIRSSEQNICQAVWKLSDACSLISCSSLDPSRVSPSHVVSRLGYCARELAGGLHEIWCRTNYVNCFCLESTLLVWHVVLSSLERSLPDFDTGCHGFIVRAKVFVVRTKLFLTDTRRFLVEPSAQFILEIYINR